jgi:hypothetical protein
LIGVKDETLSVNPGIQTKALSFAQMKQLWDSYWLKAKPIDIYVGYKVRL